MKWVFVPLSVSVLSAINCSPCNATPAPSTLNSNASWFFTVGAGAAFPLSHGKMYVNNGSSFPAPYDKDIYSNDQPTNALVNLTIGHRWERQDTWFPAYSLGLLYQHSFLDTAGGRVTQYSLPEFTNYSYNWDLSANILLASAKVNLYTQDRFSPYLTAGLGVTFNHSNYHETAFPGVSSRTNPLFAVPSTQFAYNVGAGLDFLATDQVIVNVGYLYQNLGHLSGQGSGAWFGTSLDLGSYGLNEVLAGVTYLFDKGN